MRIPIAVIAMLSSVLIGGCSHFGGGAKHSAERPVENFDVDVLLREQWRQLAETGDAEGEYQLGMSYCCGYGPGHTDTIARKWLCRAALQGHEKAQYQLARMYGYGIKKRPISMPQTMDYAYLWYGLAAAQGDQLAVGYLAALGQSMTPQQIARAREWQSRPAVVADCG
jgi:TPR repeat protein